jgi:hypothetical protein
MFGVEHEDLFCECGWMWPGIKHEGLIPGRIFSIESVLTQAETYQGLAF